MLIEIANGGVSFVPESQQDQEDLEIFIRRATNTWQQRPKWVDDLCFILHNGIRSATIHVRSK